MCQNPFQDNRPRPPALPKPEPRDSAIEDTADKVVVADKRSSSPRRKKQLATPTGIMTASNIGRRLGTKSLQIPLLGGTSSRSGNLNYPT